MSQATASTRAERRRLDRDIVALALPALGALVAEPAFLLVDTALVGHLGAAQLAGVGVGGAVLQTAVGLLIFLAYGTTPAVARLLGAGDRPGAIRAGIDGIWLAILVGLALVAAVPLAHPLVALFGAAGDVTDHAATYLGISILGLPAMLVVLAATGLLRGLQDTRTPLVVAGAGFTANAILNAILIYGAGLGVAGSAIGTVLAQWGMAAFFLAFAVREARRERVSLRPSLAAVGRVASVGVWLLLRTVSLRVALIATTVVATRLGTDVLAATQVAFALFSTLAFALDALAIAGQAMVGKALGAGDAALVRRITGRLVRWGVVGGAALGGLLLAFAWLVGGAFTSDPAVIALLPWALVPLALAQPIAGFVFVLDGVLIGAGDVRYLAWTGIANLAICLPLLLVALLPAVPGGAPALAAVWLAFSFGYLGARALTLGLRARTDAWMVLGARR
ncbi:MATE family efflux transporter [Agrococcus sp. SGAir0287]|uniref:MATE family efflux transporter n=1 Tax=Agrococcus sp. SGAir0287 TaxID=2070347 RepID=UPI0010CD4EEB|nr:MATE family efflux transporter [Agrococcus sp. SGAir0287]QCR18235.1 MATE family efflux transporter [Agrococcus sp. SGAir0287]